MRRLRPTYVLAALWAFIQVRRARRVIGVGLPSPGALRPPWPATGNDPRPVRAVLRRTGATCLVRSLVLQAWEASHGVERDVIVGVTGRADFHAHAWLDGDPSGSEITFTELVRVPVR
ncbi:MAG: lasso peptide biosynthesis protein [Acidimicrobiales bacterium]